MDFISVRDLRSQSAAVWQALDAERQLVVTSNGRPIAFLVATSPETFDKTLEALRQAEVLQAIDSMHRAAHAAGADQMSLDDINAEIADVRTARRR